MSLHLDMIRFLTGSILLFLKKDILPKIINKAISKDFDGFFVELNLRSKKILLCYSYNPHKLFIIIIIIIIIIINTLFEIGKNLHSSAKNLQFNLYQLKKIIIIKRKTTATTTKTKKQLQQQHQQQQQQQQKHTSSL